MNTHTNSKRTGPFSIVRHFLGDESGVTSIEYGLIAAATGLALAAVMPTIKSNLTTTYTAVSDNLD